MESENNKTSFISILIVFLLLVLVVVIFIKMCNNKEDDSNNEIQEVVMNDEYEYYYNSMVTKDKYYGLYFNKKVTINNIDENEMIKYAISKYIDKNDIKIENNETVKINKIMIDSYIKGTFYTDRIFNSASGQVPISIPADYVYDENMDAFYIKETKRDNKDPQIIRMLTKLEGNNNTLYFYDKAMYCIIGWGSAKCYKSNDPLDGVLFEIKESEYNTGRKELIRKEQYDENGNRLFSYEFDYDYIFDNYDVLEYKHEFNKKDGIFYWISSEVL